MPLIEWRDEFEIGLASVDHEHKELIGLINRLHADLAGDPSAGAVGAFLGEIHAKISAHFALEEQQMRALRYDELAGHKADHEDLLDEIREIMDAYEAGAYRDLEAELAGRLHDWFVRHFKTKDARLHKFLIRRRAEGS